MYIVKLTAGFYVQNVVSQWKVFALVFTSFC